MSREDYRLTPIMLDDNPLSGFISINQDLNRSTILIVFLQGVGGWERNLSEPEPKPPVEDSTASIEAT